MTASDVAVETAGLGLRYGRTPALLDCTLAIPSGRVVGLVGANGSGKTTLLHLSAGLLEPTDGTITVLGRRPAADVAQLARVGFLAQDAPLYPSLRIDDLLQFGSRLNPTWDGELAARRIDRLGLDRRQRAGRLSGGQRSQLALTLAMAKRPELLLLDEPVASLDPLARLGFLEDLMEQVADQSPTVVLSSHLLSDVERVCDHVVVLVGGRVVLAGDVDDLLAAHRVVVGPRRDERALPADQTVVRASHTERQTTVLVRTDQPILDPGLVVSTVGLEELVLAYMARGPVPSRPTHLAAVAS